MVALAYPGAGVGRDSKQLNHSTHWSLCLGERGSRLLEGNWWENWQGSQS